MMSKTHLHWMVPPKPHNNCFCQKKTLYVKCHNPMAFKHEETENSSQIHLLNPC